MKYFLLVWIGSNLLYGPGHPARFDTEDDCGTAAMLVGNAHGGRDEAIRATCYDWNGKWISTFGRGDSAAPLPTLRFSNTAKAGKNILFAIVLRETQQCAEGG